MDRINKRKQFLEDKFHELFPFVSLPKVVIQKILFNKHQRIDINSFFKLTYQLIGYDQNNHIPEETIKPVSKVISYLTSTLNSSNLQSFKDELDFRNEQNDKIDISDGQAVVIAMLNENQKKRSANILLNFLYDQSKTDNPDQSLPEVYHLFSCLYLFFSGQHQGITVNAYNKENEIVNYLCKRLDVKREFFESLYTFFTNNNQTYTQSMIKFMRRLQVLKFEQENPGIKIPLQSLVKLPDSFVLNFINLINGQAYQSSFFAKELGLD